MYYVYHLAKEFGMWKTELNEYFLLWNLLNENEMNTFSQFPVQQMDLLVLAKIYKS